MALWKTRGYVEDSEDDGESKEEDEEETEKKVDAALAEPEVVSQLTCSGSAEGKNDGFYFIDDFVDSQQEESTSPENERLSRSSEPRVHTGNFAVVIESVKRTPQRANARLGDSVEPFSDRATLPPISLLFAEETPVPIPECHAERGPLVLDHTEDGGVTNMLNFSSSMGCTSRLSSEPRISSTPITSPLCPNSPLERVLRPEITRPSSRNEVVSIKRQQSFDHSANNVDVALTTTGPPVSATRSLRKRNPIQLHPYLLESERYRQTLKSRGLKPLRITGASGNGSQSSVVQDGEFEPEDDTQVLPSRHDMDEMESVLSGFERATTRSLADYPQTSRVQDEESQIEDYSQTLRTPDEESPLQDDVQAVPAHEDSEEAGSVFCWSEDAITVASESSHPSAEEDTTSQQEEDIQAITTPQDTEEVKNVFRCWSEGAVSALEGRDNPWEDQRQRRPLSGVSVNVQGKTTILGKRKRPTKALPFIRAWSVGKTVTRPAQLESTNTLYRDRSRRPGFQARLAEFDRQYQRQLLEPPEKANPQLRRFLSEHNPLRHLAAPRQKKAVVSSASAKRPSASTPARRSEHKSIRHLAAPRRYDTVLSAKSTKRLPALKPSYPLKSSCGKTRKRAPRPLDTETVEFRQPIDAECQVDENVPTLSSPANDQSKIHELNPFRASYTISFGIVPLEVGTFFHESTFIGSGELSRALQRRYYESHELGRGHISLRFCSETLHWGAWNETVYSDLGRIFTWTSDSLHVSHDANGGAGDNTDLSQVSTVLRSVARYFREGLSFSDPVDRAAFVQKSSNYLQKLITTLHPMTTSLPANGGANELFKRTIVQVSSMALVLAYQIYQIAVQEQNELSPKVIAAETFKTAAYQLVRLLDPADLSSVRTFYQENLQQNKREAGIRSHNYKIEGYVVAFQVLSQGELAGCSFWDVVNAVLLDLGVTTASDVDSLETIWRSLFTLLPLQEIDEFGVLRIGRRFHAPLENWYLPRKLAGRLFSIHGSPSVGQPSIFNPYCRTIFARCHCLMAAWGWRKCEEIVGTLFDFFAANNLAHLKNEESSGSLQFLEDLDGAPNLEIQPQDPCFHIFLKVVGLGVKALTRDYTEKKIRNVVFRLIPNHARQYPKEEAVQQNDLNSLRNHHDLLCTLYWAAPPSSRPSVNIIRGLVDAESSHLEACRLSLRAWLNLTRFQLSTDEPIAALEPLSVWHSMLIRKLLKQHNLAKAEVEAQYASMPSISGSKLVADLLKSAISKKEQEVDRVLADALSSAQDAMSRSRSIEAAIELMNKASTADIFGLVEIRQLQGEGVIVRGLRLVKEYIRTCGKLATVYQTEQTSDDSQDYGDWSALVEVVTRTPFKVAAEHLQSVVHDTLSRLVSNVFGADTPPEDALLIELVDVWVLTARMLVSEGLRDWGSYVDAYSPSSWMTLRKTEQTRKYQAYYMSGIIETDTEAYHAYKSLFMSFWMTSLVERDSMLKFQHKFTSATLNVDRANPLLRNLPFWFNARDGTYSITLREFSERRLSLISSVLMNMRVEIEELGMVSAPNLSERRREYAELLKGLMAAMTSNYQELQHGGNTLSGTYVDLVQVVVEYLQQYTVDICPVDRFFTDSATFPLPAKDPAYVVGRLKHYGLKLPGISTHKQLSSFVQSVSERAAVDDQQPYLSLQLGDAMSCTFEDGDPDKPTLRAFLMKAIFPAYIEHAFNTSAGWILATPIVQASARMFDELLQDIDTTNSSCVSSVVSIIDTFLDTCRRTFELLVDHSGLLEQPSVLSILGLIFAAMTASLPLLDYMQRSSDEPLYTITYLPFLFSFAVFVRQVLMNSPDVESPYTHRHTSHPTLPPPPPTAYPQIRQFCAQELRDTLTKNWTRHNDQYYYLLRGSVRKHIVTTTTAGLGSLQHETIEVLRAIDEFEHVLQQMNGLVGFIDRNDERTDEGTRRAMRTRRLARRRTLFSTKDDMIPLTI